jgi:hypothetical protein
LHMIFSVLLHYMSTHGKTVIIMALCAHTHAYFSYMEELHHLCIAISMWALLVCPFFSYRHTCMRTGTLASLRPPRLTFAPTLLLATTSFSVSLMFMSICICTR